MQREFRQQQGRTGKDQLWRVAVEGATVITEWGQLDGALQTTTNTYNAVNTGKRNEKSPPDKARFEAERMIRNKLREGYVEVNPTTGLLLDPSAPTTITDFSRLPHNLRFYKPQNTLSQHLIDLAILGSAWFVRKRNGEMLIAAKDSNHDWRLYSSKLLIHHKNEPIPWSARFPHLMHELEQLNVPPNTILLGELVADKTTDDLLYVGSIMKSLTDRALRIQYERKPLHYCIWDIAWWNSVDVVSTWSYAERAILADSLIKSNISDSYLCRPETFKVFPHNPERVDSMREKAKKLGWEGFVVVDPSVRGYGTEAYSYHGKALRPKYCGKLKPAYEADFIVYWDPANGLGEYGKGKKSGGVGSVAAFLRDPQTGKDVFISKVGGGLSDADVFRFNDPTLYPMVWQLEFADVTQHGSLQFPKFIRERTDKVPAECTLDQLPNTADSE